jgi:phage tail-like protein
MDDYRYLNRGNRWLDFTWHGLELGDDGALRLASLPRVVMPTQDGSASQVPNARHPAELAGLTVGPDGNVYFSDPTGNQVLAIDGCDGTVRTLLDSGDVHTPRGLLYYPIRKALLIADSGSKSILLYDPATCQILETWHSVADPWALAGDSSGGVYVVDRENRRVVKLDWLGRALPEFWARVIAQHCDLTPAEVAVGELNGEVVVLILDATTGRVHVVNTDGRSRGTWHSGLAHPMGLAAGKTGVYLGDNKQLRLLVFGFDGLAIGAAYGWSGSVAAVALDGHGNLYVHSGGSSRPSTLSSGAYRTHGLAWGGPFRNPSSKRKPWHLIRATVTAEPEAHFQFYVWTNDTAPEVDPTASEPFGDTCWRQLPIAPDAAETLFSGELQDTIWIGVEFSGDGLASTALSQIRLDFAHETFLRYLPAIYSENPQSFSENPQSREFLARWLTLFESAFDAEHERVQGLTTLFDPYAAPAQFLQWLAGWLALELPEEWPGTRQRMAIAEAYESYAHRGTVAGLRSSMRAQLGLAAVIEEPIVQTGWWALPAETPMPAEAELSVLGAGTVLAAVEPQGAVVGTTAVLDGSTLSPQDEYAKLLFAEVAHQFTVRLYRGKDFSDRALVDVRALLQREAPAHTTYHVCVVEPYLSVGIQARVGVDTIVGEPGSGRALRAATQGGLVLAGQAPSRLGQHSELGDIHLTDAGPGGPRSPKGGSYVRPG